MRHFPRIVIGLTSVLLAILPARVNAADHLDDANAHGFGNSESARVGLSVGITSGERPGIASGAVSATSQPKENYNLIGSWLNFEYFEFWDKTRFNTLVGAEAMLSLGYIGAEKADPVRQSEPSANWSKFHGRFEGAFDYALLHWQGGAAGRVVFGAGAGGELGSYWHTDGGRLYPILQSRLQLFPGALALDLAYRFIPTTTGDNAVREHRFSACLGINSFRLGAEATLLKVRTPAQEWFDSTTLGGTLGIVF